MPIADIIARVSEASGVAVADIVGERRDRDIVRARQAVYWLANKMPGKTIAGIARSIGHRNHGTVSVGIKRAEAMRISDPAFAFLLAHLSAPEGQEVLL